MRSSLPTCAILLLATPGVFASQLTLPAQSASPGASVLVPVSFAAQANSVSGVQFDIQYDNSAMSLVVTVGDPARTEGKDLFLADLAPNKKRVLLTGLNQNLIPDGALLNLFVNVNDNAAGGTYTLQLSNVCATDPLGRTVPVTFGNGVITVTAQGGVVTSLQPSGVLNSGSFLPGPVAPGELITLIGSGIGPAVAQQATAIQTTLGGASVLFDGIAAPLLYAGPNQINAVVPFALSNKSSTQLQIMSRDQKIGGAGLSVAATAPAIFTLDSSGIGPGAILNQDSSVNSPANPAAKGSIVAIYATGAGQTNPPSVDGQITGATLSTPVLPVSVQIAGLDAKVVYAGAAPDLVAGGIQVNAIVPAGAPSGATVPIALTVGTTRSQSGVTLAVK
ncbi:MAG TPA: cohesin domain-containing protein [Bryobacteraceae bacterium]|nr:cohesin domain-containing protein [Bryobacteraceae bacterium]